MITTNPTPTDDPAESVSPTFGDVLAQFADYIEKSERLVYGAHGNAYLPGQMRTWLRATYEAKALTTHYTQPTNETPRIHPHRKV